LSGSVIEALKQKAICWEKPMKAVNKNIKSIMNPKSIAVIGATNRPGSVGLAVFRNILTAGLISANLIFQT